MSGLTGYLTTSGVDLSNIFMPIGGAISLAANNTFTGNNVFNNGITINNQVTLPTSYSAVPTITQLGGVSLATFGSPTAITLTNNQVSSLGSIDVSGGTYILMFNVFFNAGAALTLSRFALEISTSNSAFNLNMSFSSQRFSSSIGSGQTLTYQTSYIHTATTTTRLYGLALFAFTNTATATGTITCVRIA